MIGLALVLGVPQLVAYGLTRVWRRARVVEWMAIGVATYAAIWAVLFEALLAPPPGPARCGIGPMIGYATLLGGLCVELALGAFVARRALRARA